MTRFAAFIITYERPVIVLETIKKVFLQTRSPEKLLIIDNSESNTTEINIAKLEDSQIDYFRVGYNAGPAGAAKIGLQRLSEAGYDWIYWGDDNDPPDFEDVFDVLLNLKSKSTEKRIGVIGAVGHYFNLRNGNIIRVADEELVRREVLEVDSVAGGMSMIVNVEVVKDGILPNPAFFFGFEELDFCLRVKRKGYKLLVSTDLYQRSRKKYNRTNFKTPFYSVRSIDSLWRQYYSIRNLLWILKGNKYYTALGYQVIKSMSKTLFGFRYGVEYGTRNAKVIFKGIWHGLISK